MFRSKKFQKILIWTLVLILTNSIFLYPKKAWAYTYNPTSLEANYSSYGIMGTGTKTILYWGKPANINEYNAAQGRTDTSTMLWVVNIYEKETNKHWLDHNDDYNDTQMTVLDFMKWEKSYEVIVDLRDRTDGGEVTIGQIKKVFTLPKGPTNDKEKTSGNCPVINVKYSVENYENDSKRQSVHFIWDWNPDPKCLASHKVNIYPPGDENRTGKPLVENYGGTTYTDNSPREGVYFFITRKGDKDDGISSMLVSLTTQGSEQPGESKDPDAPGNKGQGGGTGTNGGPSYCDKFHTIGGTLRSFLNPLGYMVCGLISAFEEIARWILEQAAGVINA